MAISGKNWFSFSGCTTSIITAAAGLFCGGVKMDGKLLEFCHHIYWSLNFFIWITRDRKM